ncbi:11461_t:CDS:2 [Entrophospora sp. SA101]|nr:11461_t:CDS:2 [Entrophospora sp. SA101]
MDVIVGCNEDISDPLGIYSTIHSADDPFAEYYFNDSLELADEEILPLGILIPQSGCHRPVISTLLALGDTVLS